MKEYDKIKAQQAEQLGSIDDVHPMKQVAFMSGVQVVMLIAMGLMMLLIGKSI
tara:strand:+ start:252 stop:410 length:159 start_codon:yes stop_codon:yes gene_type:complete